MDEKKEDREDFAYQLARKVKEKELELEQMSDLLRKNSFKHKQTLKELESELEAERQHSKENAEIYAIQERTLLETLEKANIELNDLRLEVQRFSKYKPSSEENGENLSYEELLQKFHEKDAQFLSFKDGAITAMIDKDKEIEELNSRLAATSPEMFEDLLKEREQLLQERQDFQRKLETMEQELEKSMYEFEERRKNLENEVSEQVAEKVKELLEVNKSLESNLMEELRKSDEKILSLEAQNKALSHKLRESDEKLREFSALSQRKSEDLLQTRDESLEKELQKYEKSLEDARKTHLFELSAKEAAIKFLEAELQESSKRADAVLLEKTRVLERESALKLKLEGFEERVAELQKEFEEKLQQLLRTSAAEKEKLEQEVHHLREEVNKNRNTFPQSMNNLMNLKEDIEVFNNFMEEQPPQNLALIIPSRKELGNCENTEKNEKNAEKLVEELKEELRNNRESEISQWERELSQEKELFRSFRQEKLKESEEKNREIQEKTLELQEKARIIQEKDKEISQFSQKLRELFALEELKREKSRLESSINSLKQAFYEEKAFLQAELQRSESQAIDAKLRLAEISLDKEFLQMKLKKMDKELKNKGIVLKI